MDIHELIKSRTSIRRYKTTPVPIETVLKIVESARMAPSGANMQCWRFIIVDDPSQKKLIAKACAQNIIAKACEDAPYLIVLCADPNRSGVRNNMEFFLFDCALAMENLALAAQGEGLSTCIVGWFDDSAIIKALNIPNDLRLIVFTPLGYKHEDIKVLPRKTQEEAVFYNSWGEPVNQNPEQYGK